MQGAGAGPDPPLGHVRHLCHSANHGKLAHIENIRNMAYSVLSQLFGKTKYYCIREIDQQSHSSSFQVLNASVKFPICFFAGTSFKETSVQTFRFSFIIDNVKRSYHVLQM